LHSAQRTAHSAQRTAHGARRTGFRTLFFALAVSAVAGAMDPGYTPLPEKRGAF